MKKIKEKPGLIVVLYTDTLNAILKGDVTDFYPKIKIYRCCIYKKKILGIPFGCEHLHLHVVRNNVLLKDINISLDELKRSIEFYKVNNQESINPPQRLDAVGEYALSAETVGSPEPGAKESVHFYLHNNYLGKMI